MKKLLVLLIILLALPNVIAVSISPGVTSIDYEPNKELEFSFRISNAEGKVAFRILDSPLSQYATLSHQEVTLEKGQVQTITVKLNIPSGVELYGVNSIRVEALKVVESEGLLAVTSGVRSRLEVQFPYPNRYLELTGLRIDGGIIGEGTDANALWNVINKGNEQISYYTRIQLLDPQGDTLYENELLQNNILAGQTHNNQYVLPTKDLRPGSYTLIKELFYDDQQIKRDIVFKIGEKNLSITGHTLRFKENRINEFFIEIRNEWNQEFTNIRAELKINDLSATTHPISLQRYPSQARLNGFFNAQNLALGQYDATITINFDDLEGNTLQLIQKKPIMITDDLGQTKSTNWLIIGLYVLLIIAIIAASLIIYFMFIKNE
ncbi:MAG: hypothetical protein ACMXX9_01405 [Candidatus Woesearchaeota archaeon]